MTHPDPKPIVKAAGGAKKLEPILGISAQAIGQWDRIPLKYLSYFALVTDHNMEDMRPDAYTFAGVKIRARVYEAA